jgi:hypothetical protein
VVFDVWSPDDLLKTSPCYFMSRRLYKELESNIFSDVELGPNVDTEASITFKELYPNKAIPKYYLLRITGTAFKDDFGLDMSNKLILSPRAMSVLRGYSLADAELEEVQL